MPQSPGSSACAVLSAMILAPAVAKAQTGTIAGVVKNTTGSSLPGVMVEAASPALIEKTRTATTDDKGQYKIVDLRPGIYTVTFALQGFGTVKREGIEITTQFTALVNAELRVGAIQETVTVTGETPVVDTQRVQQVNVMTRDVIDAVPTGKTFQNIGVLVPGVVVGAGGTGATPYDVGGSSGEQQVQMAIHGGATADMVVQMDGMRFNNLCGSGSFTGVSGNDGGVEQIAFETGAISAEMGTGGIRVNLIPKEGGNTFKGGFFLNGTSGSLQSDKYPADSFYDADVAASDRRAAGAARRDRRTVHLLSDGLLPLVPLAGVFGLAFVPSDVRPVAGHVRFETSDGVAVACDARAVASCLSGFEVGSEPIELGVVLFQVALVAFDVLFDRLLLVLGGVFPALLILGGCAGRVGRCRGIAVGGVKSGRRSGGAHPDRDHRRREDEYLLLVHRTPPVHSHAQRVPAEAHQGRVLLRAHPGVLIEPPSASRP